MDALVRLSDHEISSIKEIFKEAFLAGDHLWIFGSRVNMEAKGGDIDLYVETNSKDAAQVVDSQIKFLTSLQSRIGEQKMDMVIKFGDTDLPIYQIARSEGVKLI